MNGMSNETTGQCYIKTMLYQQVAEQAKSFLFSPRFDDELKYNYVCKIKMDKDISHWDRYCFADQVMGTFKLLVGYYSTREVIVDYSGQPHHAMIWIKS